MSIPPSLLTSAPQDDMPAEPAGQSPYAVYLLAARRANRNAAELRRTQRLAAGLALHREDRGVPRAAARTMRAQLAATLWTCGRQLVLGLVVVPLRVAARETDGGA